MIILVMAPGCDECTRVSHAYVIVISGFLFRHELLAGDAKRFVERRLTPIYTLLFTHTKKKIKEIYNGEAVGIFASVRTSLEFIDAKKQT